MNSENSAQEDAENASAALKELRDFKIPSVFSGSTGLDSTALNSANANIAENHLNGQEHKSSRWNRLSIPLYKSLASCKSLLDEKDFKNLVNYAEIMVPYHNSGPGGIIILSNLALTKLSPAQVKEVIRVSKRQFPAELERDLGANVNSAVFPLSLLFLAENRHLNEESQHLLLKPFDELMHQYTDLWDQFHNSRDFPFETKSFMKDQKRLAARMIIFLQNLGHHSISAKIREAIEMRAQGLHEAFKGYPLERLVPTVFAALAASPAATVEERLRALDRLAPSNSDVDDGVVNDVLNARLMMAFGQIDPRNEFEVQAQDAPTPFERLQARVRQNRGSGQTRQKQPEERAVPSSLLSSSSSAPSQDAAGNR